MSNAIGERLIARENYVTVENREARMTEWDEEFVTCRPGRQLKANSVLGYDVKLID